MAQTTAPFITKTAFYRSDDPITNLKIRVKFRCLRENKPETVSSAAEATDVDKQELLALSAPAPDAEIEKVIGWQQKISGETIFTYIGILFIVRLCDVQLRS